MKSRFIKYLFFIAVVCFIYPSHSYGGSIVNTVHNLSISRPGTGGIRAESETRICVFCHIPHDAQPGVPLWNRSMPTSDYQMYDSHYLTQANYPIPTGLGSSAGMPGTLSRQCLSCHDGTVAIGSVYLLNGTIMGSSKIAMQGVNANGTMPSTAAGFIGTDLAKHHPVGIAYDPNISIAFGAAGSGTNPRTIELNVSPTAPIKLYSYSGYPKSYVECESCHDPHIENYDFLRVTAGANNADKINTTCNDCHDKTGWTGSVHRNQTATYTDASVTSTYGTNIVSEIGCVNCHTPHNALTNSKYLLRGSFSATCYTGAAGSATGAPCHGTGGAAGGKDIESLLNRTYSHPVSITSDLLHKDLEILDPASLQWSTNSEHATCVDCHNPHQAQAGTHSSPSNLNGWYPQSPSSITNNVSNVLKGVTGVKPSWPSIWSQDTTFTTLESASKEYQICFKCHSAFALGTAVNGVTSYTLSAEGTKITDQAWEFNPNNKSAHPVVVTLNNQTGSYAPQALASGEMKAPWKINVGNQTMYCSDCHGADNENSGDPRGPHGSNYKYMLKGPGKYWPTKPQSLGGGLWKLNSTDASNSDLFCNNCHEIYNNGWTNNAHADMANQMGGMGGGGGGGLYCVNCHVAVPHGSKRSRLIGYSTDPAPYNYNGNSLRLRGFHKASGANAYTCWNCHSSSCDSPTGCDP